MTNVFSAEEKQKAFKEQRKLLIFWFVLLGVVLAVEGVLIGVNIADVLTTRSRKFKIPFMVSGITLATLFAAFSLFFFSVKFKLTHAYVKMFRDMDRGLKDISEGKFIEFDDSYTNKDGLTFYSMAFNCRPLKRGDITMRKVLVEKDVPKIEINAGDKVRIVTHANILISYEFISRVPIKADDEVSDEDSYEVTDNTNEDTGA